MDRRVAILVLFMLFAINPFASERKVVMKKLPMSEASLDQSYSYHMPEDIETKVVKLDKCKKTQHGHRYVTSLVRFSAEKEYMIVFNHEGGGSGRIRVSLDNRRSIASSVKSLGTYRISHSRNKIVTDTAYVRVKKDGRYYIGFYNSRGACPEISDIYIINKEVKDEKTSHHHSRKLHRDIIVASLEGKQGGNSASASNVSYRDDYQSLDNDLFLDEKTLSPAEYKKEMKRLQEEILNRAVNAHPDPALVRSIIESAITKGRVKSSFDTLTTHIDPIEGAEGMKSRFGWVPPEKSFAPDYSALEMAKNPGKALSLDDNSAKDKEDEKDSQEAASQGKKDTVATTSSTDPKKLDDVLFKKGKVVDFSWSFIPFRKIGLVAILALLLWPLRNLRWGSVSKNSLIQSQKDRIKAAEIREALYDDEESDTPEQTVLAPTEIARMNLLLVSYASELASVVEFSNSIISQLDSLAEQTTRNSSRRNRLLDLKRELMAQNDKILHDDFKTAFESVHAGFFGKLTARYPHLSKSDLTLCSYLALGISTKEIASLTAREIRSVESMRNRLRKKIELEPGQDFPAFFSSI